MSADIPDSIVGELGDRYLLLGELGRGGMATVFLAEDVRHRRKVAIKLLHPELSAVIGVERFLKEIELTARLQHPHILPLFDSGSASGRLFYVMPFVEGESLRARLDREKQLPIDDALRFAREIADALSYAHAHGVVHRDVKPENILLQGNHALVADFGIALAVTQAVGGRMTQTGISLGTPQYMAPEQAMGEKTVDARADIYALGAVTYEMLAGEPPFTGASTQAILAKMMTERPVPLHITRDTVSTGLEHAVLKALAKLPADRWDTATKFAEALTATEGGEIGAAEHDHTRAPKRGVSWRIAVGAATLLAVGAVVGRYVSNRSVSRDASSASRIQLDFESGPAIDGNGITISQDGRRVVAQGRDTLGQRVLMLRDIADARLTYLLGGEAPGNPTFSPDGQWIVYGSAADRSMRKVSVEGGPSVAITSMGYSNMTGVDGDSIVYLGHDNAHLLIVSVNGGASRTIATLEAPRELGMYSPFGIPGQRVVLFCSYSTPAERSRIEAVNLDTGKRTVVMERACQARHMTSGHLLYSRGDALFAIAFDAEHLRVSGNPVRVMDDVFSNPSSPGKAFDVAANGTLVHRRASVWRWPRQLTYRMRDGRSEPALAATGAFSEPRLSPDGRTIILTVQATTKSLFLVNVARRVLAPLLKGEADIFDAEWFADSRSFAYVREEPAYDIFRSAIDGSAPSVRAIVDRTDKYLNDVAADGGSLLYTANGRVYVATLADQHTRLLFNDSTTWGRRPARSPDGRWVAMEWNGATGATNVVIVAADGRGATHRVSLEGGEEPRWTKGGRELVYRQGTAMMAAAVNPGTGDATAPVLLFRAALAPSTENNTRTYDVSADGSRFVMVEPVAGAAPFNVVTIGFADAMKKQIANPLGAK